MSTPAEILARTTVIAVVGASRDPDKPAHFVPQQMLRYGWRIIPVNPHSAELFGQRTYTRLADVPEQLGLVTIFRPAPEATAVVREAIRLGASAVWLQSGIVSAEARREATAAGIDYVEDRCLAVERARAGLSAPDSSVN